MKKQICSSFSCLLVFLSAVHNMMIEAQQCQPSRPISGTDPQGQCSPDNGTPCCKEGEQYTTYQCSPPVSRSTQAIMTINSFQKGGDGGAASACDGNYHDDNTLVVALSTGWFSDGARCLENITINSTNGMSVNAIVVDECASNAGCDQDHAYQQPCRYNIVDASQAVWEALGVERKDWGSMDIFWSDA